MISLIIFQNLPKFSKFSKKKCQKSGGVYRRGVFRGEPADHSGLGTCIHVGDWSKFGILSWFFLVMRVCACLSIYSET